MGGSVADRFWSKADRTGACWLWTCGVDKDGYGKFQITVARRSDGRAVQRHVRAHRFAFELTHGRAPVGLVMHSCDTPACVNPAHLSEGTQAQNIADMDRRDRRGDCSPKRPARGSRHGSAKVDEARVREMRRRAATGERLVDLARGYGLHPYTVSDIVHRRSWSHV